jgi:hypothetical protein
MFRLAERETLSVLEHSPGEYDMTCTTEARQVRTKQARWKIRATIEISPAANHKPEWRYLS